MVAVARILSTDGPVRLPLRSLAWRASFCSISPRKCRAAARLPPQFGGIPTDVNACDAVGMHADTVQFLREHAQTCTRLARDCPDRPTAHGLEEVAISLAAKAEELEREFELRS